MFRHFTAQYIMFKIHIIVFSFLFVTLTKAQNTDTTLWINNKNDRLGFSFSYPSYFKLSQTNRYDKDSNSVRIEYFHYEPADPNVDSSKMTYLEYYSGLRIYLTSSDFSKIAEENNFIRKDGNWFENDNQEHEPADSVFFLIGKV